MTGSVVYIHSLPFAIACAAFLIVMLSVFRTGSRYAWMSLCLIPCLAPGTCWSSDTKTPDSQQYRTETGEQKAIPLPDGSAVFLDVESEVRIVPLDGAHLVYLNEGQAAFQVMSDPARAFTVHVNHSSIHTARSQFHVRRKADLVIVSVIEGDVRIMSSSGKTNVASSAPRREAGMGNRYTIGPDGTVSGPVETSMWRITSWLERRLAFRDNTLVEVAAEFNRYNKTPKLRVEGEVLKMRTLSAVLDADNPQGFLDYLANDSRIEFERPDPDLIVIRMRSRYGFADARY
jgi:transmembrane sensor